MSIEKRGFSFRQIKNYCSKQTYKPRDSEAWCGQLSAGKECNAKNCPRWKRAKKAIT